MRHWLIKPSLLCQKHLMAEHLESHMFYGAMTSVRSLSGFYQNGLFFGPKFTQKRHDALALHIRGHKTPLEMHPVFTDVELQNSGQRLYLDVDPTKEQIIESRHTLWQRCHDCRELALEDLHARKSKIQASSGVSGVATITTGVRR